MTVGKPLPSLTSGRAPGRAYDEMLSPDGTLRPHWKQAEAFFSHLGDVEIERRWSQARKVLHDNGVAYNLYSDAENPLRAWELNPIPLCIAADEWDGITAAVSQRARLLNGLLNDIYGPQEVLKKALFPPRLSRETPPSCARVMGCPSPMMRVSFSTPPISPVLPTGAGGRCPIVRRRHREWAMRLKIAWCCRASSRRFSAPRGSHDWAVFSSG